jgi:nitrate reductase NapAB chaperone NapD
MIIKSYLAHPVQGKQQELKQALEALPGCSVIPATNRELLILLTESENDEAEEALVKRIEHVATLQMLTLVSGHNEAVTTAQVQGTE